MCVVGARVVLRRVALVDDIAPSQAAQPGGDLSAHYCIFPVRNSSVHYPDTSWLLLLMLGAALNCGFEQNGNEIVR